MLKMNKKRVFLFLFSLFVLVGIVGGYFLYEELTGDFREVNISFDPPYNEALAVSSLDEKEALALHQILDQPFHWLDHGHQVFAFLSQDGKYVLKIFKFKRLKPSVLNQWFADFPLIGSYFREREKRRVGRLEKLFTGYHLAYTQDREHSGLLFIHLNKSDILRKTMVVTDRMGFSHELNLDQLFFAIQEKGRTTKSVLKELLDRREVDAVKRHIGLLFDMYVSEYAKGIVDWDHNIMHNTGFVGERPVRLDLGQLQYDSSVKNAAVFKKDLVKIASKRFSRWFKIHYPEFEPEISLYIEDRLAGYGSSS